MDRLEQAKSKLERIKKEIEQNSEAIRKEHELIPFGQPNIVGRRDIYKDVKRMYAKERKLVEEQRKQERRIDMLTNVKDYKEENKLLKDVHVVGKSDYATIGAKTSVNNLEYFKNKVEELEKANIEAKAHNKTKPPIPRVTYGAEITKLKRKIAMLEVINEKASKQVISEKSQKLIDNGSVKQWQKKPIYFFVKGLRKVALELDEEGNFHESEVYRAYEDSEKTVIKELLSE